MSVDGGRRRALWAGLVPAVAAGLLVVVQNHWNQYTSDSVAQQSLVRTWLDVGHGTAYVPLDTWILKLPLYFEVEALPLAPGLRLVIEVLALNVACFALLGFAGWWLARLAWPTAAHAGTAGTAGPAWLEVRVRDVAVPLVWLAALSGELGANKLQPNYRNIELGLSFLALAAAAAYLDTRSPQPARLNQLSTLRVTLLSMLAAVLLALLWVDDPYFLLLTGLPFGLLCLVWFGLRRLWELRFLIVAAVVALSLLITLALSAVLEKLGLHVVSGSETTDLSPIALTEHGRLLRLATAAQLGLGDTDPASIVPGTGTAWSGLSAGLTVVLLVIAVLAGLTLTVHGWRRRLILPAFLGLHWIVVVAGFMVSARVVEVAHGRYLILAFYDLVVTLAIALPAVRRRWPRLAQGVVLLLLVSIAANVAVIVGTAARVQAHGWDRGRSSQSLPASPAQETAIQDAVASTGLRRGYAQFWSANLTLYRSGGAVSVNSIRCIDHQLVTDNWLTDTARRTAASPGTFLVVEPYNPTFWYCDRRDLQDQFGVPDRIVPAGAASLYVFGRDIGPDIPAWTPN